MFMCTNDRHTFLPVDSMAKLEEAAREGLGTETMKVSMGDSNLLGVYMVINSTGAILPNIATEKEIALMKSTGLNVCVSTEKYNAHGNNIALNDLGGVINPHIGREEAKKMEDALGIELVPMTIAGYTTVGSMCLATKNGFLVHFKASEEEMTTLESILKVKGNRGTVNTGTGFVSYGAVANMRGYIVGEQTTPFESGRLEEALGLIR